MTLGAFALLVLVGPCRLSYFRVCSTCGCVEHGSDRQLPMLPVTYWHSGAIEETPLSRAAREGGVVAEHPHNWLFGHGSGNGTTCAIGEGRHLLTVVNSQRVADFIRCLAAYRGSAEAQRWLRVGLDPRAPNMMAFALDRTSFPSGGFADRGGFNAWLSAHRDELDSLTSLTAE